MLALSDEALARLAIGASRIVPHARGRWLQRLAQKLDPLPRPLTRQGRWRQRQRNGTVIYRIELRLDPVIEALIASERLSEGNALQHRQVEIAIGRVVEDCCAHVLEGRARTQAP
jgi:hypothetical protein